MSNKAMSWAVDCHVKGSHKLVLMLLAEAHNGHTGACFPSQDWIEEKSGLADSTVAAVLKDLEDWKLLTRHTKALGRGKGSRRDFELHLDNLDPYILEVQNTGFRGLNKEGLDPPESGSPYKDKPEEEPEREPEYARDVFNHYNQLAAKTGWTVHSKLTDAIRKPLKARIEEYGAEKVKAFIDAMAELPWTSKGFSGNPDFRATLVFICRPRTFAEHFDKLVKADQVNPQADLLAGDKGGIDHRLDWCFQKYAEEKFWPGAWQGGRYGWGWRPDEPEAAGLYPDALYARHGVPRPDQAKGRAA